MFSCVGGNSPWEEVVLDVWATETAGHVLSSTKSKQWFHVIIGVMYP